MCVKSHLCDPGAVCELFRDLVDVLAGGGPVALAPVQLNGAVDLRHKIVLIDFSVFVFGITEC